MLIRHADDLTENDVTPQDVYLRRREFLALGAAGIGLGLVHRWRAGQLLLRGAGALVTSAGLVFLWRTLA